MANRANARYFVCNARQETLYVQHVVGAISHNLSTCFLRAPLRQANANSRHRAFHWKCEKIAKPNMADSKVTMAHMAAGMPNDLEGNRGSGAADQQSIWQQFKASLEQVKIQTGTHLQQIKMEVIAELQNTGAQLKEHKRLIGAGLALIFFYYFVRGYDFGIRQLSHIKTSAGAFGELVDYFESLSIGFPEFAVRFIAVPMIGLWTTSRLAKDAIQQLRASIPTGHPAALWLYSSAWNDYISPVWVAFVGATLVPLVVTCLHPDPEQLCYVDSNIYTMAIDEACLFSILRANIALYAFAFFKIGGLWSPPPTSSYPRWAIIMVLAMHTFTIAQLLARPCLAFTTLRWIWFTWLSMCVSVWVKGRVGELGARIGKVHFEFLLYASMLGFFCWANLDVICSYKGC